MEKDVQKNESRLRRKVYETIQKLIEEVKENELIEQLPYLDCLSWDEVVEERYLGKCCGLPVCSNIVTHNEPHKYHIDRKSNKIFETCKERSKFCCDECFKTSIDIRAQLDSQPLWITGESFKRMSRKYKINSTKKMVEQIHDHKAMKRNIHSKKSPLSSNNIEIVQDTLLANMKDLKIAERDGSTTDEEAEHHDEFHQTGNREDSDEEIVLKRRKDNEDFVKSVQRFVSREAATVKNCSPIPSSSSAGVFNLTPEENEKLARIREKYSKKVTRKAPILIDAPSFSVKKAEESNTAESIDTTEEIGIDGEKVDIPVIKKKSSLPDPTVKITPCSSEDENFVVDILRQWWTDKCNFVLKSGGLRPTNFIDKLLRKFLAGEKGDDIELEDVDLPELDAVDVEKRRLQILLRNIKPTWLQMEQRLGIRSSQVNSLSSLLGTFRLGANNIAGFERQQLRLLTATIWRIICHFSEELEESFFPNGYFSKEICDYLEFCGVEEPAFAKICDNVFEFVK